MGRGLYYLYLNNNNLTAFGRVGSFLDFVSVRNNSIQGTVPYSLYLQETTECAADPESCVALSIDLSQNLLSGQLYTPRRVDYIYTIASLNLSHNSFAGSLKHLFYGDGYLDRVEQLDLSGNRLKGSLDVASFAHFAPRVNRLYLQGNMLSGQLPVFGATFSRMQLCERHSTSPSLPPERNHTFKDNAFCGSVPELWTEWSVLREGIKGCNVSAVCPAPSLSFTGSLSTSHTVSWFSTSVSTSPSRMTQTVPVSTTFVGGEPLPPEPTSATTVKLEEVASTTTTVASVASLLAAADTSSAVMQAMLDVMGCGEGGGGGFGGNTTSPAAYTISVFFDYGPLASAFGNLGLMLAVGVLHGVIVKVFSVRKKAGWDHSVGLLRYPAVPMQVAEFLLSGVVLGSGVLLVDSAAGLRKAWEGVLGALGFVAVLGLLAGKELLRRFAVVKVVWAPRPRQLSFIREHTVPYGVWETAAIRRQFDPAFFGFQPRWTWLSVALLGLPFFVALMASLGSESSCTNLLWVLAALFFVAAVFLTVVRPFRRPSDSLLAPVSYMLLGVTTVLKAMEKRDAVAVLGYLQTIIILTRSLAAMICDRIVPSVYGVKREADEQPTSASACCKDSLLFENVGSVQSSKVDPLVPPSPPQAPPPTTQVPPPPPPMLLHSDDENDSIDLNNEGDVVVESGKPTELGLGLVAVGEIELRELKVMEEDDKCSDEDDPFAVDILRSGILRPPLINNNRMHSYRVGGSVAVVVVPPQQGQQQHQPQMLCESDEDLI